MNRFRKILTFVLFLLVFAGINADEGMWMPHQMKNLDLQSQGLKMDPGDLYKQDGTGLMSAVVYLGGGTGEFVSEKGLILTNHHVAFGAIQRASDEQHDYITRGFMARKPEDEIQARGYIADVLLSYEDITHKVLPRINKKMTPLKKYEKIEKILNNLIKAEEKKGRDIRCHARSMYSGNKYFLFKFKRLRDIRLVYAPPRSLGNFGGDIDNWMWPRHTCDFSFLRAYVSRDNIGAPYHKDNIPYRPKSFLKISLEGVKQNDFTFIMGYPGRTYRNYPYAQFKVSLNSLGDRIDLYQDIIRFFEKAGQKDRSVEIKYASLVKGLNNGLKNRQGKLEGFEKQKIARLKEAQEQELANWINSNPRRKLKYGKILPRMAQFFKGSEDFDKNFRFINNLTSSYFGSALLSQAYTIYRTVTQLQKPDKKRDPGYQNRNLPYLRQRIELAERRYDFNTDKSFLKFILKRNLAEKSNILPKTLKAVFAGGKAGIDQYVDNLYKKTILKDPAMRLSLLKITPRQLLKKHDPFIALAAEIEDILKDLREKNKSLNQQQTDLKGLYLKALLEKNNANIAPDANSSIRFTCGTIDGYSPADAVYYTYLTTLKGVMEKETGKTPFIVPEKLKELYKKKDYGRYRDRETKEIPACFLNTTNVTGGNSGSPVFNARGEQIGIVFDMTYESVIGDYYIIPELQRTISVDIRYVLFITEKFSGAHHLIREMTILKE